jgi:hypothetical protein
VNDNDTTDPLRGSKIRERKNTAGKRRRFAVDNSQVRRVAAQLPVLTFLYVTIQVGKEAVDAAEDISILNPGVRLC